MDNYYINEVGTYEFLFSGKQPKAWNFRKHCCNTVFPHIWQQLTDKTVDDLRCIHQQTIIEIQGEHRIAITRQDNQIFAIQYENVGLQGETQNAR